MGGSLRLTDGRSAWEIARVFRRAEEAGYAARHGPGQRRGGGAPRGGRAGPRAAGRGRGGLRGHALRLRAGEPPQRGRRGADGQDPQPRGHGLGGRGPEVRPGPPPRGEKRDRARVKDKGQLAPPCSGSRTRCSARSWPARRSNRSLRACASASRRSPTPLRRLRAVRRPRAAARCASASRKRSAPPCALRTTAARWTRWTRASPP